MKRVLIWITALAAGLALGMLGLDGLDALMAFVATAYTRLFQLLAVPTIVLAVVQTLSSFGWQGDTRHIFVRTLTYTLLTTLVASAIGLGLYLLVQPGQLAMPQSAGGGEFAVQGSGYYDHLLSVVPNNIVRPFLEGNVLSLMLIAFAVGVALSRLPESDARRVLLLGVQGLQDILFLLIRGLIWTLPLGIVAFAAQLSAQLCTGLAAASIGKYVGVILAGNLVQMFLVLPLFLLARGIRPLRAFSSMSPAVLMALFTKSSAATLPVTIESAEQRLGVSPRVSRFVLPICTTINMNGCAAFILVTSLFVMQNSGMALTWPVLLLWLLVSVVTAVGNAGVPMGCYFLTFSLMAGIGADVSVMGVILPIYTLIDMVETAENVWSDSCVCAMTDRDMKAGA